PPRIPESRRGSRRSRCRPCRWSCIGASDKPGRLRARRPRSPASACCPDRRPAQIGSSTRRREGRARHKGRSAKERSLLKNPVDGTAPGGRRLRRAMVSPAARLEAARTLPKTASRRNARKWRDVAGFSAASGVDRGAHARQLPGSRPELGLALHLPHVPFHLKTGEPFHVAWKVDIHSHALLLVGG